MYKKRTTFWAITFIPCIFACYIIDVHAAYIDPSVMTYAIQAIAGIAITLGTVAGFYWRKIYSNLHEIFAIEAKSKICEETNLYFEDNKTGERQECIDSSGASPIKTDAKKRTWSEGVVLAAGSAFLIAIYGPLEMYFSNKGTYWYDFYTIFPYNCLLFLIIFVFLFLLIGLSNILHKKLYIFVLLAGLSGFICTYIQGTLLVGSLPTVDGNSVDWSKFQLEKIQSIVLWIVVIGMLLFLFIKLKDKQKGTAFLVKSGVTFITLLEIVTLIILCIHFNGLEHKSFIKATKKNEFEMSNNKNFIIFLVDCVDSAAFNDMMKKNPEYETYFEDFTYYPDTLGMYPYTQLAIPQILSGIPDENDMSLADYQSNVFNRSLLFESLKEKNYKIGMYEESLIFTEKNMEQFDNALPVTVKVKSLYSFSAVQLRMICYKYAPFQLKYLSEFSPEQLLYMMDDESDIFSDHNQNFYRDCMNKDITYTDENCFKFIHIIGAHPPFVNDKNVGYMTELSGTYEQNIECVITICKDYINKLKNAGVYNNTAMIIMADHGYNGEENEGRQNPLLMIKGINETHEYTISNLPVTLESLPEIYCNILEGRIDTELFSGISNDNRRYLDYDGWNNYNELVEKEQTGKAWDEETLIPSGTIYTLK